MQDGFALRLPLDLHETPNRSAQVAQAVSVPRTHLFAAGHGVLMVVYAAAVAAVPGLTASPTGRQLCGSNCARSRFFSVGRRSNTSLR